MKLVGIPFGHIAGIRIVVHSSMLFMAGLLVLMMADHYYPGRFPGISTGAAVFWSSLTALAFFASILWHELAHAMVARHFGMEVKGISLDFLGGMTEIGEEPRRAHQEFFLAMAGPLSTLILSAGAGLLARALGDDTPPGTLFTWLALVNLSLAGLNLIPAFPLDGGRMLRAGVWYLSGRLVLGTAVAVRSGQAFALTFGVWGMVSFWMLDDWLSGLFAMFIAWYLWSSGRGQLAMTERRTALELIPLAPLVQNQLRLNAEWPLVYAADVMTLNRTFIAPVMKDAQLVGVFLLDQVAAVPRLNWGTVRVANLMRPLGGVPQIGLESNVFQALLAIERADTHYALVTSEGGPVGVAARRDLIHLAQQYG